MSDPRIIESRPVSQDEKIAYKNASGHSLDSINFNLIRIIRGRSPTVAEAKNAALKVGYDISPYSDKEIEKLIELSSQVEAISMPDGYIYTYSKNPSIALIVHEINHQDTYQNGATITYGGVTKKLNTAGEVFEELVNEGQQLTNPYIIPGTLEYQAQQIQDKVKVP